MCEREKDTHTEGYIMQCMRVCVIFIHYHSLKNCVEDQKSKVINCAISSWRVIMT